ncbi:MAG TPA: hypothetical protein VHQ97_00450 [Solirubrobacterales bacterium]|jgi:hypothetical protein|nr:hypothetical protein [Solirubrobacterales bacterium]
MRTTSKHLAFGMVTATVGLLCALLMAATASAITVQPHTFGSSFDGSDAIGAPAFGGSINKVDVDESNGLVYVGTGGGYVYKLNENGVSEPFDAESLGGHSVIEQEVDFNGDLEVDNSGTETQGRIYPFNEFGPFFHAFLPSGAEFVAGEWPLTANKVSNTCGIAVRTDGDLWFSAFGTEKRYTSNGEFTRQTFDGFHGQEICDIDADTENNLLTASGFGGGSVEKRNPDGEILFRVDPGPAPTMAIDRSNNDIYVDRENAIYHYDSDGNFIEKFGEAEGLYPGLSESRGIAVNEHTHAVYAANPGHSEVDVFMPGTAVVVPTVTASKPDVTPATAILRGTVDPEGLPTTACTFEWGTDESLSNKEECDQGNILTGSGAQAVSIEISGLAKGEKIYWALRGENLNGSPRTRIHSFYASERPTIVEEGISKVNTDAAQFSLTLNPNGSPTHYRVEYGTEAGSYGQSVPVPDGFLDSTSEIETFTHLVFGLSAETEYHYRMVAENDAGTTLGPDRHFKTFPLPPKNDPCPNALVRKQTAASLLLDCRAYEIVSAANQGGYDVDSEAIAGDTPLEAAPNADDRFLYSVRFGALPGIAGSPTTFGHDPYVAARTADGWVTTYVGLPAEGMPSATPYGSPLAGHDAGLGEFVFGGEHICEPCFGDGSINMPLRLSDGSLVKGISGPLGSNADPAGEVRKAFSADGSHFVFGSEQLVADGGNDDNGSVTIYERPLPSGPTEVVSTTPAGSAMTGTGISELDVSSDGSRVLFGKLIDTDSAGNEFFDLYMHLAGSSNSVQVADTPGGVIYDGMTADGSTVYFSTADALAGDQDTSVDLYRADVSPGGAAVARVSTGIEGTGNVDTCSPAGSPAWNTVEGEGKCNIVAFAGGSGVAAQSGAIYFVSPEKLDGSTNGVSDEANLYIARPGSAPHFVATIDTANVGIEHGVHRSGVHSYGDFQVTPDGRFSVFNSARPIAGAVTHGHTAIYRYAAEADEVECVSCGPSVNPDTHLEPMGLNLTNDGRVFFTTLEQLALRDTNEAADVYEWENGNVQLVSSGIAPDGSILASASADGRDAFFFTRETLAPQDKNGSPVRIYDAREEGGFLYIAPPFPCKASDECHGPGTQAAEPPPINTKAGSGLPPKGERACKRGFVKRHRKCVKRRHRRHHRHHRRHGKHHKHHSTSGRHG